MNNWYTNPQTGQSEQITDSRALTTREERIAAAQAEQAAFETQPEPARTGLVATREDDSRIMGRM